jgi:NADH-quinone oxidoreductase subunit J
MILADIAFYLFASLMIFAAVMVISARNPVHSVLYLILAFFNAAGLFMLCGAEFLAMILMIVYVGAVAVLFLFVVMMLDVTLTEAKQGFLKYLPIGGAIGLIVMAELIFVMVSWMTNPEFLETPLKASPMPDLAQTSNTKALGLILYTDYFYLFEVAGLILLVAMIGAIVLTMRERVGVKRQNISNQVSRTREDVLEIKKVATGEGINL